MKTHEPMKRFFRRRSRIMQITRLVLLMIFMPTVLLSVPVFSQNTLEMKIRNARLEYVLKQLQIKSGYYILYNTEDIENIRDITVCMEKAGVREILEQCLADTDLTYSLNGKTILIGRRESQPAGQQQEKSIIIKGMVQNRNNVALPGVTVLLKGTTLGVSTDEKGRFTLNLPQRKSVTLVFSFVGLKTREVKWNGEEELKITMDEEASEMDEVIVTGYFERNKESFTGALKTVKGEDLRKISTTSVFTALSILDPSIQIRPNNTQGSNPNNLPDIIIRGTSSLNASQTAGVNAPLIVIDGVESSIQALYDMDIFDIDNVTTLKDASATALYGEQAANGVILVTRKKNLEKELRLSYNMTGKVEFPDLSAYDMMNAREKLDFELQSNLYGNPESNEYTGESYINEYLPKLARVNSGIDTDWLSKPLRNSFSHNHNLSLSGEGSGVNYQITANYGQLKGVMKEDKREKIGFGLHLSYNHKSKLIFTLRANYAQTNVENSKYGKFSDYVQANPYDSPYDRDGLLQKELSYNLPNPLYEASLSSFSTSKDKEYTINASLRWNVCKGFFINATGNINSIDSRSDDYISPLSKVFLTQVDPTRKGQYYISSSESVSYSGRITFNFNRNLDDSGSMFSVNAGSEINKNKISPYSFIAEGFLNDKLTDITFAHQYPSNSHPSGQSDINARIAFISSANVIYKGRYFVDGSLRFSGSSKFGKDQRYEPYWSVGVGWNLHRENWFADKGFLNLFRLRASYGHTGSLNFQSYQAITTYRYDPGLNGKAGAGAIPITMGNRDLKAQVTKNINIGLTSSWLKERLEINFDYYNKKTVDMIVPISMPFSSGIASVNKNIGEQLNRGFEFSVSGVIADRNDWYCRLTVNGTKNYNELVKIGDVLLRQNKENAAILQGSPTQLFVEGESSTTLYAVRSAGIDPADGNEIFVTKDGKYTKTYDPNDKVSMGDTEPKLRGSLSAILSYRNFSFNINAMYSLGGYIYNTTRAEKVEMINARYNADRRAYSKRWEKPGDVVEYVRKQASGTRSNVHTSRFVEKENYLSIPAMSLTYQFDRDLVSRWGFYNLNVGISLNDVGYFSTVARERGTDYPFARNVSFTISTRF